MGFKIEKASKKKLKAKILLESAAGCGKSYSALILARNLGKNHAETLEKSCKNNVV